MISVRWRRLLAGLCAALSLLGTVAAPAWGDAADPLFTFFASEEKEGPAHKPYPPPGSGFSGPCGVAVDSLGGFYVADYYHHAVDAFRSDLKFLGQLPDEDPLDGPCGLAIGSGSGGDLYVNNFHRNVVKYTPSAFPIVSFTPYGPGTTIDSAESTGVAVEQASGRVYVDDRTYVAAYEASGAPVLDGGVPLQIGAESLENAYGVAVSAFPATAGRVYVPDAGDDTVKVYDPAVDADDPVQTIDGHETPSGGFVSLRDSAVAVDRQSGRIFVADDLQPEYRERPEAAIYAFEASGAYVGRLKFNVIDGAPPGLAIDNSAGVTQGRVYVTSGNGAGAAVYAYAPGALTTSVFPAADFGAASAPAAASGEAEAKDAGVAAAPAAPASVASPPAIGSRGPAAGRRHRKVRHRHRKNRSRARHGGGRSGHGRSG